MSDAPPISQPLSQETMQSLASGVAVNDTFQNLAAKLGVNPTNLSGGGTYRINYTSKNRWILEAAYRSSWIVGAIVDVIADDMVRAGVDFTGIPPEDATELQTYMQHMGIARNKADNLRWGRLYGGSGAFMLIAGQNPTTPLDPDRVPKDSFQGLLVYDRWQLMPRFNEPITDPGPYMGLPKYYDVVSGVPIIGGQTFHYSRMLRAGGVRLPYWQRFSEMFWDQSVVERLWDKLLAFDSSTQGAAQLMFRAHLRTLSVENYRNSAGTAGAMLDGLYKQLEFMRIFQSNEGISLIDAKDKFEAHQYAFSGISEIIQMFANQLAGAGNIPMTRLYGQSPDGMNATGDSDFRNYYNGINQRQESDLREPDTRMHRVLFNSYFGRSPPQEFSHTYRPLWGLDEQQRTDIAQRVTSLVVQAAEGSLIGQKAALQELRASSEQTGIWTSITDEMINEAEELPPPVPTSQNPQETDAQGNEGSEGASKVEDRRTLLQSIRRVIGI